ncbi:MAG: ATP-binding protein [bacterium]|nr:ATP-binding protein [bacterium]
MDKKVLEKLQGRIADIEQMPITAKVLLYSDPGVGKTTAAALSPKPLIINCEGGTLCLNKFKEYYKKLDIKTFKPDSIKELQEIFWYLKSGEHDRQTVILDSLSEIQRMSMDEILADPKRDDKYDRDTPILQDYGKNTQQLRRLVRAFRDLPMNVVFTCLAGESKDETDGSVKIGPSLTPKLASDVMGYVDVVGYMFVSNDKGKEGVRKLLTQPKGKYLAKDRSGKLGIGMLEPTMFEVFNKITDGQVKIPEFVNKIIEEVKKHEG